MKTYAFIFRMDITTAEAQPSAEQMETYMKSWIEWLDSISETGQLAEGGNHLSYTSAKVLRPGDVISDGPHEVNKESVAGYILVFADDMDGAVQIARRCPILHGTGTSVEIRETASPQ